ncbi:helix-turn-helix transcriptional regulator [Mesorhizobium sp. KR1-2]|uniref:helix-turn-helix domain-containing protein n=1 Tax=Mesorhizobium sp. KR1-2 TaxID=3156609 RepID=UPI0032B515F6
MSETIHMALIGRIPERSFFKSGIKGTLLATSEKIAFAPTNRQEQTRELLYDELSYFEVSSVFGWNYLTFYTTASDLKIRCRAPQEEIAALYDFVNERISAAQGGRDFSAKYLLTQVRDAGGLGSHADEVKHDAALNALFDQVEPPQSLPRTVVSGESSTVVAGQVPSENKSKAQRTADNFPDENAFLSAFYGAQLGTRRNSQTAKTILRKEAKTQTRWRVVVPVVALIAIEFWWLIGLYNNNQAAVDVPRRSSRPSASTRVQKAKEVYHGPLDQLRVAEGPPAMDGPRSQLLQKDAIAALLEKRVQLGKVLGRHRDSIGMTQLEVAQAIGRDVAFIVDVERGANSLVLAELLEILTVVRLDMHRLHQRVAKED